MIPLSMVFLLFLIYAFLGWCMEVCVALHDEKKLINRGFLIGPICPIYGVGVVLMQILLYRYMDDPVVLFVMAVLVCSFLEYFTGYIMEKLFKARWWDYSHKKFNINGRICLDNLVAFGVLALFVMYLGNPFFFNVFSKINIVLLNVVAVILCILLIIDVCISFKIINGFKHVTNSVKKDNTEEITKRVREMLINRGGLYKRLVSAFNFETSEIYLKELTAKVKTNINKAVLSLEEEKNKKIKEITKEYNNRIDDIKRKFDGQKNNSSKRKQKTKEKDEVKENKVKKTDNNKNKEIK